MFQICFFFWSRLLRKTFFESSRAVLGGLFFKLFSFLWFFLIFFWFFCCFWLVLHFFLNFSSFLLRIILISPSSHHPFLFIFLIFVFLFFFCFFIFTFGQVKDNARHGRFSHPSSKVFEFVKLVLRVRRSWATFHFSWKIRRSMMLRTFDSHNREMKKFTTVFFPFYLSTCKL